MILDNLINSKKYFSIHPHFEKAFTFLQNLDFKKLSEGKYIIDGDEIFVLISRYKTVSKEEKKWESHRKYIDIQYLAKGKEKIGFSDFSLLKEETEYVGNDDYQLFSGNGDFFTLHKANFAIFFPVEPHKPGCIFENSETVVKVVIKVKIQI
jgi:biofilm protein TabA